MFMVSEQPGFTAGAIKYSHIYIFLITSWKNAVGFREELPLTGCINATRNTRWYYMLNEYTAWYTCEFVQLYCEFRLVYECIRPPAYKIRQSPYTQFQAKRCLRDYVSKISPLSRNPFNIEVNIFFDFLDIG